MPNMGGWEWVIVLIIVLLVFGVGRVSQLGKELGEGIKAFRQGIHEGQETDKADRPAGEEPGGAGDSEGSHETRS